MRHGKLNEGSFPEVALTKDKINPTESQVTKDSGGVYDEAAVFLDFLKRFLNFLLARDVDLAQKIESEYLDDFIAEIK